MPYILSGKTKFSMASCLKIKVKIYYWVSDNTWDSGTCRWQFDCWSCFFVNDEPSPSCLSRGHSSSEGLERWLRTLLVVPLLGPFSFAFEPEIKRKVRSLLWHYFYLLWFCFSNQTQCSLFPEYDSNSLTMDWNSKISFSMKSQGFSLLPPRIMFSSASTVLQLLELLTSIVDWLTVMTEGI